MSTCPPENTPLLLSICSQQNLLYSPPAFWAGSSLRLTNIRLKPMEWEEIFANYTLVVLQGLQERVPPTQLCALETFSSPDPALDQYRWQYSLAHSAQSIATNNKDCCFKPLALEVVYGVTRDNHTQFPSCSTVWAGDLSGLFCFPYVPHPINPYRSQWNIWWVEWWKVRPFCFLNQPSQNESTLLLRQRPGKPKENDTVLKF